MPILLKYNNIMNKKYPRDMIGYGADKIKVIWPNNAKLALQIVLNYEEGAENSVLHGDKHSETFLSEIIGAQPIKGRHMSMESLYEYGSKRGFWRLHELFKKKKIVQPMTVYRALNELMDKGEIHKSNQNKTFLLCNHSHAKEHNPSIAICKNCGDTEELESNLFNNFLKKHNIKKFDFKKFQVEVSTICSNCN